MKNLEFTLGWQEMDNQLEPGEVGWSILPGAEGSGIMDKFPQHQQDIDRRPYFAPGKNEPED